MGIKEMFRGIRSGFVFLVAACSLLAIESDRALNTADATGAVCAAPVYHQFDFWVGDWDVFDVDSRATVAHARIDSILGGCVLPEDYEPTVGYPGQSLTIYDVTKDVWHQTWMTSGGTLLEIEGNLADGEMVLSGHNQRGEMVRGTWKPVNGGVREVAVKSADGGKTWKPWFDIMFYRTQQMNRGTDDARGDPDHDKETVAALDTEYQAAVKRNDADTMHRILSDDFILVTSSGKLYTKNELIDEARSGRIRYEHQEDTDKTVRLWGDTAVVTAKLWEKGTEDGKPFDHKLWFSDVYRRTPTGWRYVFAQSAYHASPTSASKQNSETAAPPGFSTGHTGTVHDFDYFVGGWITHQRRLKAHGIGSDEWEEFPGNLCMSLYLGGMATVDELYFPTKGSAGLTLRTFDPEKRQWSIYWASSATGKLDPVPVVGGFEGDRGEFYAEDRDNGRPIKVRYAWNKIDHDHARWQQAFSYDNKTWETNWTADFTRANTATVCEDGR